MVIFGTEHVPHHWGNKLSDLSAFQSVRTVFFFYLWQKLDMHGFHSFTPLCLRLCSFRQEFGSDQSPDLTREVYLQDIHCVGSLCKLYFRELPNPLLTYELYKKFTVRCFPSCSSTGTHTKLRCVSSFFTFCRFHFLHFNFHLLARLHML